MQKLNGQRGAGLLLIIMLISITLVICEVTARIIFSGQTQAYLAFEATRAFYLAEAAIELGKAKVNANPAWYTDLHHSEEKEWFFSEAVGLRGKIDDGEYIVVKMKDKQAIYGIGISNKGRCLLKVEDGKFEKL